MQDRSPAAAGVPGSVEGEYARRIRVPLPPFALTVLVLIATACGSSTPAAPAVSTTTVASPATSTTTTAPTSTAPTTTAAPPPVAAGCGQTATAGTTSISLITSDGASRTATQLIPQGYDPETPTAVVLNFHGFSSVGTDQHGYSGLPSVADRENFVLVSPQGTSAPVFDQTYWNTATGRLPGGFDGMLVDDVAYVGELLDDLTARLCVDPDRVHATGLSNGGFFSSRLACSLSDRVASIATVGGIFNPTDCAQDRPVAVLAIHGTADPIVPFDATESTIGDLLGFDTEDLFGLLVGTREPIPEIVDEWAERNGCEPATSTRTLSATVERRDYSGCTAATSFIVVEGGGHTWPGEEPRFESILGTTDATVSAAETVWEWFVANPRRAD